MESGAVTDKRERWQGEKQGDGGREKREESRRGEERCRGAGRSLLSGGFCVCMCARGDRRTMRGESDTSHK